MYWNALEMYCKYISKCKHISSAPGGYKNFRLLGSWRGFTKFATKCFTDASRNLHGGSLSFWGEFGGLLAPTFSDK